MPAIQTLVVDRLRDEFFASIRLGNHPRVDSRAVERTMDKIKREHKKCRTVKKPRGIQICNIEPTSTHLPPPEAQSFSPGTAGSSPPAYLASGMLADSPAAKKFKAVVSD